ncbi:MAG: Fic/DOC family protein [Spirochaetia bacterium]|nr:Fic/DOC family protein [Spirochaetia bacterium]
MNKEDKEKLIIYQTKSGSLEFKGDFKKETIWASQADIVKLFKVDQSVVSRHIKNIFKDGEVLEKSNMQKMHIANSDKPVYFYSLDVILSVGYRTNSKVAIEFRKWATKTLRKHLVDGYTINKKLVVKNYKKFLKSVEDVKNILPSDVLINTKDVLELISLFADTWLSLDAYDKGIIINKKITKKEVVFTSEKLLNVLFNLKKILIKKGEAKEIFGQERGHGSIVGIVGNVMQTFDGKDLYQSIEEKAAYLLYFMVKNHPFVDGNKRSGAYSFIWFLNQAKILDTSKITPPALTALTILVAESNPKDKDRVIQLILSLLK